MMIQYNIDNSGNGNSETNVIIYNINLGTVENRYPSRRWEKAIGATFFIVLTLLPVLCAFFPDSSVCAAVNSALHIMGSISKMLEGDSF